MGLSLADGLEILKERGFIEQCTDINALTKLMGNEPVSAYVGIDPTASSIHIGHTVPLFALHHLQEAGHKPIVIVGSGTAMIGDPTGRSEVRKMLTREQIVENTNAIKKQVGTLIDFDKEGALLVDNYDWLGNLNYLDFLRDIGKHFSVNKMLSFETYKMRMETGLSFIEFNYQILQSFDFMKLNEKHGCRLQIGGNDQWGNIVAGVDLTRRVNKEVVFGLTFPLVKRADGKKMGKSEKGALFLDPERVSPYEFFQYWRNVADADVEKFLLMFTFIPVEDAKELGALQDADINKAKEILAYEVTAIIHGKAEADKALEAAKAAFSKGGATDKSSIPSIELTAGQLAAGINIIDLFALSGLCASKGEARRLITQGGAHINDEKFTDIDKIVKSDSVKDNEIMLRAGKKRYFRIILK